MRDKYLFYVFAVMLLASLASAEVSLSQPRGVYNIGDELALSITLRSAQSAEGFLKITFICANQTSDIYLAPIAVHANQEKRVDTNITLGRSFLRDLGGECSLLISSPVGDATSQSFEISDEVEVSFNLNKLGFSAGEQVQIRGNLLKPNTKPFSGFVEITLDGTDVRMIRPAGGNQFQLNVTLPENLRSGTYRLQVRAYEKDVNDEVTNEGMDATSISVSKIPQKIEIAIATQSVVPGNAISFKVFLYDQANEEVQGDVSVVIKEPEDEIIMQQLVKTNEVITYPIEQNANPGYWKIEATFQQLNVRRLFYVENQELATFEIIGDTLLIRNIGNTPYRKAVQIAIGDEVEIKELELDVGDERRFRLVAPDGIYRVSITDGEETLTLDTVSLTGNAVGIISEKSGNIFIRYPLVWIFIVIVFGMFVLMMFERFSSRKFIAYNIPKKTPIEVKKEWTSEGLVLGGVREAEHAATVHGHKEEAALIAFRIKNFHELTKENLKSIETLFQEVYDKKGVVYKTGNYLIIILTPSITKTFKNNVNAVKLAKSISEKLQEYNKKFLKKVNFGVGVNYGGIIVEPLKDRMKFSSVSNALSLAKRIADLSHGEVLLSREVNTHVDSEIKTEKTLKEGLDLYTLRKVTSRESYHGFLQGFLERNK